MFQVLKINNSQPRLLDASLKVVTEKKILQGTYKQRQLMTTKSMLPMFKEIIYVKEEESSINWNREGINDF